VSGDGFEIVMPENSVCFAEIITDTYAFTTEQHLFWQATLA
jgi:hypothetical protein